MGTSVSPHAANQGAAMEAGLASEALEGFDHVSAVIAGRINVSPKRLVDPGPCTQQLDTLLALAAAAPDHGHLLPWRFVLVPGLPMVHWKGI